MKQLDVARMKWLETKGDLRAIIFLLYDNNKVNSSTIPLIEDFITSMDLEIARINY